MKTIHIKGEFISESDLIKMLSLLIEELKKCELVEFTIESSIGGKLDTSIRKIPLEDLRKKITTTKNKEMTPKEKAWNLILEFRECGTISEEEAIQGALIAVREIIFNYQKSYNDLYDLDLGQSPLTYCTDQEKYWTEVKQELENL